jgi:hypothetical protein
MGNSNWSGFSDEDRKQEAMERGEYVEPRKRSKRDNGFYGHTHPSMHKKVKCYGEK